MTEFFTELMKTFDPAKIMALLTPFLPWILGIMSATLGLSIVFGGAKKVFRKLRGVSR